jgi:hypothetical protein
MPAAIAAAVASVPSIPLIDCATRSAGLLTKLPKEILMRHLVLAILAIGAISTAGSARAQTYDPNYPVCLHVYGRIVYYECRYTSLPQCNVSASGRAAQCELNPYFASAEVPIGRPHRRHRHVY